MKRLKVFLITGMLLLSCAAPVTALADSKSTTVHYSVPASVTYREYDGTSTTQKVAAGETLKAPESKGIEGYVFEGWMDLSNGQLWDFEQEVIEHLTLTACYVKAQENNKDDEGNENADIQIGEGQVSVRVESEEQLPSVTMETGHQELIEMLALDGTVSTGEIQQVAEGADLEIDLIVKDASLTISKQSAERIVKKADDYTVGQYLDISLMKYVLVNGEVESEEHITHTSKKIAISVKVPDDLINTDQNVERTYIVIRDHEGTTEILDTEYDAETGMITFWTDWFSDYAIAYKDTETSNGTAENSADRKKGTDKTTDPAVTKADADETSGTSQGKDETGKQTNDSTENKIAGESAKTAVSPKTGDTFATAGFTAVLLISGMGVLSLCIRRKN